MYFNFWISRGDWNGPIKFEMMRFYSNHVSIIKQKLENKHETTGPEERLYIYSQLTLGFSGTE